MSDLAMLVRIERARRGLSQRALARLAGGSHWTISMIESGKTRRPTLRTLVTLMDALGLNGKARREWLRAAGYGAEGGQTPAPKPAAHAQRAGLDLTLVRAHLEAIVEHLAAIEQFVASLGEQEGNHER